jgi:ADP-ribose pyrophosphatase YjhB (NUDIX family)
MRGFFIIKVFINMTLKESIRRIIREETSSHESKRHEVFYGFLRMPNFWSIRQSWIQSSPAKCACFLRAD